MGVNVESMSVQARNKRGRSVNGNAGQGKEKPIDAMLKEERRGGHRGKEERQAGCRRECGGKKWT